MSMNEAYEMADMLADRNPDLEFKVRISHRKGSKGPQIAIYRDGAFVGHVGRGDFA